jgi:hypothetical protein
LKKENLEKYGLPKSFYRNIILPPPAKLKVFNYEDVMNHRKNLSTIERLKMLNDIEEHLLFKIQ